MDFTERMLERNRSRYGKAETKESVNQTKFPLKEVHHNTVTTIASTSGTNKVTIETTVTMRKLPKRSKEEEVVSNEDETSCTEVETESVDEKENETSDEKKCPLRKDTRSMLERLGVLYSDDPSRLSSPIHRAEERFLTEDNEVPVKKTVKNSARSARLAALAETINHWEDEVPPPGKETQGFARTESGHRLIYNYDSDEESATVLSSNKPESPRNKSPKAQSPAKAQSPLKAQSPASVQSPSSAKSPAKPQSPFKAQSPAKPHSPVITKSPTRASPAKGRYGSPVQMGTSVMRTKDSYVLPTVSGSSDEDSTVAPPTMGVKQLRSPRKAPSSPGSVLDQVHRYEQTTSPTKRTKDPAELPLAQRMALFERTGSAPVLPKAPFAMPVPVNKLRSAGNRSTTTQLGLQRKQPSSVSTGSTSSLQDRLAAFESGADNAQKGHMRDILSERQKEIEMLKHRWDGYKGVSGETSSSDYEPSAPPLSPAPPPPPMPPPPQPFEYGRDPRYHYEEVEEERHQEEKPEVAYPVLKEVKKFKLSPPKPGCIYPCLSDMETESEVQESEIEENDNNRSSSSETSRESDVSSLGRNIVRLSRTSLKRDWLNHSGNEDNDNNEIDDFLEEALESSSSTEPTPPKRTSYSHNVGTVQSRSFEYSTNVADHAEPNHPLLHTVSFYRKQQNMTLKPLSPTRHIQIDPSSYSTDDSIERMEEELDRELRMVEDKIRMLHNEVKKQQAIISQASQALNLCYSTIEFSGSTEQLEAEKLLLLATQRRQAALHEIQRLQVEQTIRPHGTGNKNLMEKGSLTLSQITVPLKMDVVQHAAKDDHCYYVICVVHCDERVLSTDLMCAPRNLRDRNKLTFPNVLTLNGLYSDFKVTVEVYTMTARSKELIPHDVKYHINTNKKDASKLKLTPKKGKGDSKLLMPTVQSPGGPMAVRTSAFSMAGYVIFSLREIKRKQFTLNKNAYTSVLEGSVQLKIDSEMSVDIVYRGFLTMYEDISGFGAWHRRWCLLKGDKLSYWRYPEDESTKFPLDTIELSACSSKEVDVVSRDVCARHNTFLLETARPALSTDVNSLVLVRNGNTTTIRHLLSADTKEERIQWCQHLNKALALMRAWGVTSTK